MWKIAAALGMALALVPVASEAATRSTVASWYGSRWTGRLTASGERFNHRDLTAASLLGIEAEFAEQVLTTRARLAPDRIGAAGPVVGAGRAL